MVTKKAVPKKKLAKKPSVVPTGIADSIPGSFTRAEVREVLKRLANLEEQQLRLARVSVKLGSPWAPAETDLFGQLNAIAESQAVRGQVLRSQVERLAQIQRQLEAKLDGDDQVDERHGAGHGLSGGSSTNDYDPREDRRPKVERAAGYAAVSAPAPVRSTPEVILGAETLDTNILRVCEGFNELRARLSPVLRPDGESISSNNGVGGSAVPFADRLLSQAAQLHILSMGINDVLARLELP